MKDVADFAILLMCGATALFALSRMAPETYQQYIANPAQELWTDAQQTSN